MTRSALIVDDNRSLAEDLAEILEAEGYAVNVYSDPSVVLAHAKELAFDVALIDVRMPGVDGVTLQRSLRIHHPDACYVMMTGYSDEEHLAQARASGVTAVLSKPVPLPALFAALATRSPCALLVVEDDPAFLHALCEALDDAGYTCHPVGSAAEARVEAARLLETRDVDPPCGTERRFALVVDVRLPDGDGATLAAELSGLMGAPVVVITGSDAEGPRRILAERCAREVRVLEKPFSPSSLLRTLRDITGAPS
jgi:two-component system, response regulator PdtaR